LNLGIIYFILFLLNAVVELLVERRIMGILIKANFKSKLTSKLSKYRFKDKNPEYQKEIFSELFTEFPQFKAHVAAYVERNYCGMVINDEDHSNPSTLTNMLSFDEIMMLNKWIVDRNGPRVVHQV
jgi:hypothetical protein